MKKIFCTLVMVIALGLLTACSLGENDNDSNNATGNEKIKGNCIAVECIKLLKPENTVAEVNQIIGFEGELTDEQYNEYYWEISENTGIVVTYYSSGKTGTIKVDTDRELLKNSKVDLSQLDTIKAKINDGITYNQIKSYVGNTDGVITEKSTITTKYTWVDSNGGYLNASFSVSSGKCTSMFGVPK